MACKPIDVSMEMGVFVFPDNPYELKGPFNRVGGNNREYVYDLTLCTQSGTHIQGPHYFLEDGRKISDYPIEFFEGEAYVFDSVKRGIDISVDDLKETLHLMDLKGKILILRTGHMDDLLKTQNLEKKNRPGLSLDAAKYLCEEKGIRMIGIDSVGVESIVSVNFDVNVYLCKKNVVILEGLVNLSAIEKRWVWIEAYPLKINGVEGTPCRAIVKEKYEK